MCRPDIQPGNLRTKFVGFGPGRLALPTRLHGLDQTLDRMPADQRMGCRGQRQTPRNLADGGKVQPVGTQLAARRCPPLGSGMREQQIATRPEQPVARLKLQAFGLDLESAHRRAGANPAGQRQEFQRLQARAQAGGRIHQRDVGNAPDPLPLADVRPDPQRAPTSLQGNPFAQTEVGEDSGDLHPRKVRKHLALPVHPATRLARQQRAPETADQLQAIAPALRKHSIDPEVVAANTVAHEEIQLAEDQGLGRLLLINPAHARIADDEFMLGEEPVGDRRIGVLRRLDQWQPGHIDASVGAAPHFQSRLVDEKLIEVQAKQRTRRQRSEHPGQAQGLATLRIEQAHVTQLEGRHHPAGTRLDLADAHWHPECTGGHGLQPRAEVGDSRHNEIMHRHPCKQQQDQRRQQKPHDPAHGRSGCPGQR